MSSPASAGRPSQAEILQAAARVRKAQAEVLALSQVRDRSAHDLDTWRDAAANFHVELHALYDPLENTKQGLREGDVAAAEDALSFLAADPWCFRSGYMKSDLMHLLANRMVDHIERSRLQIVVLQRIANPQPRLLRATARLAAAVWDEPLAERLRRIGAQPPASPTSMMANAVGKRAREQMRTRTGQS
jgi:hypothetical protein